MNNRQEKALMHNGEPHIRLSQLCGYNGISGGYSIDGNKIQIGIRKPHPTTTNNNPENINLFLEGSISPDATQVFIDKVDGTQPKKFLTLPYNEKSGDIYLSPSLIRTLQLKLTLQHAIAPTR
jgi:hypothetical protein